MENKSYRKIVPSPLTKIQQLHKDLLNYLITLHYKDGVTLAGKKGQLFTMRKTNISRRLEKGYWFQGTDNFLSMSFWDGKNWKEKRSNIVWVVMPDGKSYLDISCTDSRIKEDVIKKHILPILKEHDKNWKMFLLTNKWKFPLNDDLNIALDELFNDDTGLVKKISKKLRYVMATKKPEDKISKLNSECFYKNIDKVYPFMRDAKLREVVFF